ncbi:MAG: SPFH domain-containing protein [Candidatus Hermodarchaeota archaeon]
MKKKKVALKLCPNCGTPLEDTNSCQACNWAHPRVIKIEEIDEKAQTISSFEGQGLLEWVPAYFCELFTLKNETNIDAFSTAVVTELYKKGLIRRKRVIDAGSSIAKVRHSLSEIRASALRARMQELVSNNFQCILPTEHIRFPDLDDKSDESERKMPCFGKIICEKVPRELYYNQEIGPFIQAMLVREHERAVLMVDGKPLTVFPPGIYDISNQDFHVMELYYLDNGNISTRWGTSTFLVDGRGTAAATQVRLRLNGTLVVRITNQMNFLFNIVKNEAEYYERNLAEYVKDKLIQTINAEMSQADPFSIYQDAEKVMAAAKTKTNEFFSDAGIEIFDLAIGSCRFDDEVEKTFQERLQAIKVEGAAADADTTRELHKLQQLKELGIDIKEYVRTGQQIEMAKADQVPQPTGISNLCPHCNQPAGQGKFCQHCGKSLLPKFCTNCGQEAGTGKFFQHCGSPRQ